MLRRRRVSVRRRRGVRFAVRGGGRDDWCVRRVRSQRGCPIRCGSHCCRLAKWRRCGCWKVWCWRACGPAGCLVNGTCVNCWGAFGVGRRSVQRALRAKLAQGRQVFSSPRNPPQKTAGAAVTQEGQQKKCFSVSGAERVKRGRPARLYRVPTVTGLLRWLKLKDGGSDPLTARDLRSPGAYRSALHRALIARRPGRYSRRWLGARLGVSIWTSRRYDRRAGLSVQARYQTQLLDEHTLAQLPQRKASADGRFLASEDGRRWPAVQGLARRLLRSCRWLWYMCQGWNHYEVAWVEPSPPVLTQASSAARTPRLPGGGYVTGRLPSPPAPLPAHRGEPRPAAHGGSPSGRGEKDW